MQVQATQLVKAANPCSSQLCHLNFDVSYPPSSSAHTRSARIIHSDAGLATLCRWVQYCSTMCIACASFQLTALHSYGAEPSAPRGCLRIKIKESSAVSAYSTVTSVATQNSFLGTSLLRRAKATTRIEEVRLRCIRKRASARSSIVAMPSRLSSVQSLAASLSCPYFKSVLKKR